ncbi:MAG: SPASM domain-containing protein [Nanoarchaeota archaeon]
MPHGSCGALVQEVAIQPNGDVTMCPGSSDVLGNILKESLAEILENEPAREMKKMHSCDGCLLMKLRKSLVIIT